MKRQEKETNNQIVKKNKKKSTEVSTYSSTSMTIVTLVNLYGSEEVL